MDSQIGRSQIFTQNGITQEGERVCVIQTPLLVGHTRRFWLLQIATLEATFYILFAILDHKTMLTIALYCATLLVRADGFAWTPALVQNRQIQVSETALMSKAKSLRSVKDRWFGRQDLATMADVEVEISEDDLATPPPSLDAAFVTAEDDEDEIGVGREMTGTIFEMNEEGAFLEVGGKMSGFLPAKECSLYPIEKFEALFEIGQEITGTVIGYERGQPVISLRESLLEVAWQEIMDKRAGDEPFEVTLVDISKVTIRACSLCYSHAYSAMM